MQSNSVTAVRLLLLHKRDRITNVFVRQSDNDSATDSLYPRVYLVGGPTEKHKSDIDTIRDARQICLDQLGHSLGETRILFCKGWVTDDNDRGGTYATLFVIVLDDNVYEELCESNSESPERNSLFSVPLAALLENWTSTTSIEATTAKQFQKHVIIEGKHLLDQTEQKLDVCLSRQDASLLQAARLQILERDSENE